MQLNTLRNKLMSLTLLAALVAGTVLSGCGGHNEEETDKTAAMRGKQEKDD